MTLIPILRSDVDVKKGYPITTYNRYDSHNAITLHNITRRYRYRHVRNNNTFNVIIPLTLLRKSTDYA